MSDFGSVIQNPEPVPPDPVPCLRCKGGTVGKLDNGRASCVKCSAIHGFMRIRGEVRYGICL